MPELLGELPNSENLPKHTITGILSNPSTPLSATELEIKHSADEDSKFAGLGLRLHFDSCSGYRIH